MRKPLILLASVASMALTAVAVPAHAVTTERSAPPATPVSCGSVLQVTTRLTADLTCPTGNGLTLANGVTLNLGGHTLTGNRDGVGLTTPESGTVTIENGSIAGWKSGIANAIGYAPAAATITLKKVAFLNNAVGTYISLNPTTVQVTKSRFLGNDTGLLAFKGPTVRIDTSQFSKNSGAVMLSEAKATITTTVFTKNGDAISGNEYTLTGTKLAFLANTNAVTNFEGAATISDSVFRNNTRAFRADSIGGTINELFRNRFLRNTTAVAVSDNIHLQGNIFRANQLGFRSDTRQQEQAGFPTKTARLEDNTFTRNGDAVIIDGVAYLKSTVAVNNTGYGIYAPRAIDLGGNVAYGNGTEPQCTGVICTRK